MGRGHLKIPKYPWVMSFISAKGEGKWSSILAVHLACPPPHKGGPTTPCHPLDFWDKAPKGDSPKSHQKELYHTSLNTIHTTIHDNFRWNIFGVCLIQKNSRRFTNNFGCVRNICDMKFVSEIFPVFSPKIYGRLRNFFGNNLSDSMSIT